MPTVSAATSDVLTRVRSLLSEQAHAAAGNNDVLSKIEQQALGDGLLKTTAQQIRDAGGAGTRVTVDVLVQRGESAVAALLGTVNQSSGPGASKVSIAEIQALAGLDVDAARLVASAYQAITGRAVDVGGAGPVVPVDPGTPPPAPTGKLAITGASMDPPGAAPYTSDPVLLSGGGVQLPKGASLTDTVTLQLGARTIVAHPNTASGPITNLATSSDIVEAIRRAAPDLFVRVVDTGSGRCSIELWDALPPPPASAIYLFAGMTDVNGVSIPGPQLRGAKTFVANWQQEYEAGSTLSVRLDDKVYTATRNSAGNIKPLMRSIRDQMEADGHTVSLKEYTNYAPWTLRVVD